MLHNVHSTVGKKKGKFIKKKIKSHVEKLSERSQSNQWRKQAYEAVKKNETVEQVDANFIKLEGRRVIELEQFGEELWCHTCDQSVSIKHTLSENILGLVSDLRVLCLNCKTVVRVRTSKKSNDNYYDTNLKLGISILDSEMGISDVNTVLSSWNVPAITHSAAKRYERFAGKKMEELAKQSCADAIQLEKRLTLENQKHESKSQRSCKSSNEEQIVGVAESSSSEEFNNDKGARQFVEVVELNLFEDDRSADHSHIVESIEFSNDKNACSESNDGEISQQNGIANQEKDRNNNSEEPCSGNTSNTNRVIVHQKPSNSQIDLSTNSSLIPESPNITNDRTELGGSADAGWSKRGRSHNSMSGHSTVIGDFSGQVIAYAHCDIYCRKCLQKNPKDHDCKRNHSGSSKAMEADMAVEMVLKNDQLLQAGCIIKTLTGDDDAASMASLRKLSDYSIHKLSDFNHVKKTLTPSYMKSN